MIDFPARLAKQGLQLMEINHPRVLRERPLHMCLNLVAVAMERFALPPEGSEVCGRKADAVDVNGEIFRHEKYRGG